MLETRISISCKSSLSQLCGVIIAGFNNKNMVYSRVSHQSFVQRKEIVRAHEQTLIEAQEKYDENYAQLKSSRPAGAELTYFR